MSKRQIILDFPQIRKLAKTEKQESETIVDKEWDAIDTVITSKGSSYKYLTDGTTQRFKKVENKYYKPQNALVYIPDYEELKAIGLAKMEEVYGKQFKGEADYNQFLLKHIQTKGYNAYIIDDHCRKLETNKEIAEVRAKKGYIGLALVKKVGENTKKMRLTIMILSIY